MLRRQCEIQFRIYIYIYTRTPQIEYSRHKKLRVFYIFEFADDAVSYIYIHAKSTDRIFHWNHFWAWNILSVDFAYIYIYYIYIYETVINLVQKLKKTLHFLFMNYSIINIFIWYWFFCIFFIYSIWYLFFMYKIHFANPSRFHR